MTTTMCSNSDMIWHHPTSLPLSLHPLSYLRTFSLPGLETNARPLARGELNSVRASGSSGLTSPVGEWVFFFFFFRITIIV